ncbi:hypothetical protein ACFWYW_50150 [Nonomuraea sp. NPDC059023]|uniref:hypothetical protein n=1 Tax=unclassified Nonomuraea TaxID=2593643 RepID=UPI0036805A6D
MRDRLVPSARRRTPEKLGAMINAPLSPWFVLGGGCPRRVAAEVPPPVLVRTTQRPLIPVRRVAGS